MNRQSRHSNNVLLRNGIPVDSGGGPTVDPTENVKALMEASILSLTNEMDLRARLGDEQIKRMEQEAINSEKMTILRSEHYKEIRHMESDRVDKIRSVDVANAAATAAQLLSAVQTLASTAQATAETLRNQVAATAAAVASQTERVVNPIIERLALLEKTMNMQQGRSALADPAMNDLVIEMRKVTSGMYERVGKESVLDPVVATALVDIKGLLVAQTSGTGRKEGSDNTIKWILAGIAALGTIVTLAAAGIGLVVFLNRAAPAVPASVAPQVIYVPAPAAGSGAPLPGTTTPR